MHLHTIKTTRDILIIILFPILLLVISCTPTRADDFLYKICSPQNYTTNSSFQSNLLSLLKSLPSKTSLSGGFYSTSIGSSLDTVYGLALCRGDDTPDVCQMCLNNASRGIVEQCPNGAEATIFYELCQIRYSLQNFLSTMVYAGKYPISNNSTRQNILDQDKYTSTLNGLMTNLISQAVNDPSGDMFATGEATLTSTHKLYGLGQCTRDISRADCQGCLTGAAGDVVGCCSTNEGGIVVDNSCSIRYELYRFYQVGVVRASPVPPPSTTSTGRKKRRVAIITSMIVLILVTLMGSWYCYQFRKKRKEKDIHEESNNVSSHDFKGRNRLEEMPFRNSQAHDEYQMNNQELPLMDLSTIELATDYFSDSNKLGHGGFGIVYKGRLSNGNEIAVKRLSRKSWQGLEEFKNEVILIARLQHRNLVKLLGYGIEGEEKLLIYEFMPNKSLDLFIFDETNRSLLDWTTRFNIIVGIARGLLYLHEDSRLKIIHRDLKPNNVLLDNEMNAKISDFGMARIFGEKQSHANTKRAVGTCGYMAPEYAMEGIFSVKTDVFSFGVVLLEILSGKRSNGFYLSEHSQTLLAYAWHLWNGGRILEFIDSSLMEMSPIEEILRCIHIGLLCVQEDAADRPTMSFVLVWLGSDESIDLPQPTQPAFSVGRFTVRLGEQSSSSMICSGNELTISDVTPR